ncbi:hypothetical protein LRLP16767_LR3C6_01683 [Limosilactobacillus reuteri subsp. porcinus]|uniref:Uncharacterized protein n=1 Tax=Limosilactobacillus reuteri TaxID=1598 RepID=A0A0U5KH10_LIMRT|nr:hypothetical protein LRLP16767_LR3C6_01683 [Limosilactobacillus reuteri subsp. porcinus]
MGCTSFFDIKESKPKKRVKALNQPRLVLYNLTLLFVS